MVLPAKSSGHASRKRRVVKFSPMNKANRSPSCREHAHCGPGGYGRLLLLQRYLQASEWRIMLGRRNGGARATEIAALCQVETARVDCGNTGVADEWADPLGRGVHTAGELRPQ